MKPNTASPEALDATDAAATPDAYAQGDASGADPSIEVISARPQQFIFSPKHSHGAVGVQMLADGGYNLINDLKLRGLDIKVVAQRQGHGVDASATAGATGALLIEMDAQRGRDYVQQSLNPNVPIWVDENRPIYSNLQPLFERSLSTLALLSDGGPTTHLDILVTSEAGSPLAKVVVHLYSALVLQPVSAITGDNGVANFQIPVAIASSIAGIVAEPRTDYWSRVIRSPVLATGKTNLIQLRSYASFNSKLLSSGTVSWGVDKLGAATLQQRKGSGIRIGIIDSGCDASHPMLAHISRGIDFNKGATPTSWRTDELGHGTHVAGIVGGWVQGANQASYRGVAPQADIYIYKVFPQGDFFALGAAIEAAIKDGMDVINMSLGSRDYSNDIAQNIAKARDAGIACFVAAGNSGDAVQFPANLTASIAVAALGHKASVPDDAPSFGSFAPHLAGPDGYFSPSFTCFGPSIDFAGPGVGVISSYPGGGYKALDGTSMATPHLAGLAALYLEGEPSLVRMPKGLAKLEALIACMKRDVRTLNFAPDRVGLGMPFLPGAPAIVGNLDLVRQMTVAMLTAPIAVPAWGGGGGGFSGGGASSSW